MKICKNGLNFIQVYDDYGNVRICGWTKDGDNIGNLISNSFEEVFNSEKALAVRQRLICGDYSKCKVDDCPWLARGEIGENLQEIEEIPQYPDWVYLAYENVCNYNCITCTMHERMKATDKKELEKRYDKIDYELSKILPHVKRVSANGQGEIFVSKRIMKLLSEWKPLAPAEECSVVIETNGSLFDEEHWKIIENLGKYHLTVSVTVMSFNEHTYQRLSGTKLPITKIEENLRYIYGLREKGIINDLRIATVVSESNFRELPEFTRRCIEEFGADYVRLRNFVPWGKRPIETEWFMDVRNPYHPDHEEYLDVMKHPIFKHPAVHDWSGGRGTSLGPHPDMKRLSIEKKKVKIQSLYINDESTFIDAIAKYIPKGSKIAIYGIGDIGKTIHKALKKDYQIEAFIERILELDNWKDIPVIKCSDGECGLESVISNDVYVIITPLGDANDIRLNLEKAGIDPNKIFSADCIFQDYLC